MEVLEKLFSQINEGVGKLFAWSTSLLVLTIIFDVLLRYVFNMSFIWLSEIEVYLFSFIILFGAGYTLKHDKHVRVDVFYDKWPKKRKALVNLIGGILFLAPWCVVSIIACWKYFMFSFTFKESSSQSGGLPYLFILKFCLVLGFILLLLQGIASIRRAVQTMRGLDTDTQENKAIF